MRSVLDFPILALLAAVVIGGVSIAVRSEPGMGFAGGLATGAFAAYQNKVKYDDTDPN